MRKTPTVLRPHRSNGRCGFACWMMLRGWGWCKGSCWWWCWTGRADVEKGPPPAPRRMLGEMKDRRKLVVDRSPIPPRFRAPSRMVQVILSLAFACPSSFLGRLPWSHPPPCCSLWRRPGNILLAYYKPSHTPAQRGLLAQPGERRRVQTDSSSPV